MESGKPSLNLAHVPGDPMFKKEKLKRRTEVRFGVTF